MGFRLVKFRGLDLLISTHPSGDLTTDMIAACGMLASLPHEHREAGAIGLALRSRLELRAGDPVAAERSLQSARALLPAHRTEWFERAVAGHVDALTAAIADRR